MKQRKAKIQSNSHQISYCERMKQAVQSLDIFIYKVQKI